VAELPEGYREVSEDDRKKAQVFFGHGDTKAALGQFDYAIELFLNGLRLDPDAVEAHRKVREISLKRKASGGKSLGMLDAMKLKKSTKDEKENFLNAEKLLAFDPGNTDYMLSIAQNAAKAGYYDTVLWIGPIFLEAEASVPKPDVNKFLTIKDVFKSLKFWQLAGDALHIAMRLKPGALELSQEAKNIGAMQTIQGAGYDKGGTFRDKVKDMKQQLRLLDADKEVADVDSMTRQLNAAEEEFAANPEEPGKMTKLVEALAKTEKPENEERAIKLLQEWFDKTKQYRFRKTIGVIRIKQMMREEKARHKAMTNDPESKQAFVEFRTRQAEFELKEFTEWAKAYPTDMTIRFDMGKRQLMLKQFDDAIGSFQAARNDPKFRVKSLILLGHTFFQAGFLDEADETLSALIKDYQNQDSEEYLDMLYTRGCVLEQKGMTAEAIRCYSTVFQKNSGYRDVSARIKRLRSGGQSPPANAPAPSGGPTNQ
jgi:tetratricopeptide (TPR) repeat protein